VRARVGLTPAAVAGEDSDGDGALASVRALPVLGAR
jgi:hypothetical protein